MAKVKFCDLKGVSLRRREDESVQRDIVCECVSDEYDIVSRGDVIFEIDLENKTINRCNVKYIYKDYNGEMKIYYCDAKYYRDLKPTKETFYDRLIPPHMKCARCMYNKSVYGLLCTNMEDAMKRLAAINAGKYFGALEGGDKIYMVDKESNIVREETVEELFHRDPDGGIYEKFGIKTENYYFECYNSESEFEENTSHFSDSYFHVRGQNYLDCHKYSIHLEKAVADRVLREYLNSKAKTEKKKTEAPEIPVGTPIRHTDNKNQKLHYGDVVAYVRKDWKGHTDISFGIIIGDSEKKIKILDEEEVGKKKRSWSDEKHDGIHMLEPANILLVRLGKQ